MTRGTLFAVGLIIFSLTAFAQSITKQQVIDLHTSGVSDASIIDQIQKTNGTAFDWQF